MSKDYNDDFVRPPCPTQAGLMFPARSKQTVRGFTLAMTPAERYWRQIISASQGERETCLLCLAQTDLWNLHDQPTPVSFIDVDGRQRSHRFDYLLELRSGERIAIAVKPYERAEKLNFAATLERIKHELPINFADRICLVTEHQRHRKEVENAKLLNFFRRCPDEEADFVVKDLLKSRSGEFTISDLIAPSDLGARGYRAVFRAIYAGQLRANKRQLITPQSIVSAQGEAQ